MFGIGFTELLLISIIGILFLGPDKLPGALVEMGKFINSVKTTVSEAKSSFEEEMKIADLKDEALSYKQKLDDATSELQNFKNINFDDFADIDNDKDVPKKTSPVEEENKQVEQKNDLITFDKTVKKEENNNV